jgi:hypothetical protein
MMPARRKTIIALIALEYQNTSINDRILSARYEGLSWSEVVGRRPGLHHDQSVIIHVSKFCDAIDCLPTDRVVMPTPPKKYYIFNRITRIK